MGPPPVEEQKIFSINDLRSIFRGLADRKAGRMRPLSEVKKELGIK